MKKLFIKYIIYLFISTLFVSHCSLAQQAKEGSNLSPLKIGDIIPEELWDAPLKVLNDPEGKSAISLKDFKGKLIILDFWATYCGSCINNFPKMEQLQSNPELKDKIKILAITNEKEPKIKSFFSSEIGKDYTYVHSVVEDIIFNKYFPHRSIPYIVWITADGKFLNSTSGGEVTLENIKSILSGRESKMFTKVDMLRNRPLFLDENFYLNNNLELGFYSIFVKGGHPGYGSGNKFWKNEDGKVYGRQFTNSSLGHIYFGIASQIAQKMGEKLTELNIINHTKNKYLSNPSDVSELPYQDRLKNTYSFDYIGSKTNTDSLYHHMLSDLNRYTEYFASMQYVDQDCYVIKRTTSIDKLKTNSNKSNYDFGISPSFVQNYPLKSLFAQMIDFPPIDRPVVDETNYDGNIDMVLNDINNLEQIKKDFKKYGLEIKSEKRKLLTLVIKNK